MSPVRLLRAGILLFLTTSFQIAGAGEISGLPPALLPGLERDFAFNFSNDFLGRGGSVDDFRTQQIIVSAKLDDRFSIHVDHSILTLTASPEPGRIDQLAASVDYKLLQSDNIDFVVGTGVRSIGDFAGDRMQNGFHRLIGSDIDDLQYTGSSETDLTAWAEAQYHRDFAALGTWTAGYWLRAGTLVSTSGEWDSTLSALATLQRNNINFWIGLRGDWRAGYSGDPVLAATASAEEDAAFVLGMRFGALLIETVQQIDNDASYGQIMLVSSGARRANIGARPAAWAFDFAFLVPDVEVQLAGKRRSRLFVGDVSSWREAIFAEIRYGQPQYKSLNDVFIDTLQLGVGMEWERPIMPDTNWLSFYSSAGLAWRSEELNREVAGNRVAAPGVDRAAATISGGLRFFATTLGQRWNYRLQLGISAVLPFGDETVQVGVGQFTLQKPQLGLSLGMSFDFR